MKLGDFRIDWLEGGVFELDGGTMFGVVPKVLWSRKARATGDNYIAYRNAPLLVTTPGARVVIDTGLGNKLTDKQKNIFRVTMDWDIPGSLEALGLNRQDITHVILTHCDFDHAGGIVMNSPCGEPELTFPNAMHYVQRSEWEDVLAPNIRSENTYWAENFRGLKEGLNLTLLSGRSELTPGVSVLHTAGHTRGHQAVLLESGGGTLLHMADLMPSAAHFNPLWVMAYDNFPMDAIGQKQQLNSFGIERDAWFSFYHDFRFRACKFDASGAIRESIEY